MSTQFPKSYQSKKGPTDEQNSFLVKVLKYFSYRPRIALKHSWVHEEVLTWELIRALDVLPQKYFLRPIVEKISSLGQAAQEAAAPILKLDRISITEYPNLGLKGDKRNKCSDIGIGFPQKPTIWIEAKTAEFTINELREKLIQQLEAMKRLYPEDKTLLVTLLPKKHSLEDFPNISWVDIVDIMKNGIVMLKNLGLPDDISNGYIIIANEIIKRTQSHPNRADGWV